MFKNFAKRGAASFLVGGQWGSEGKGAAAAALAVNGPNVDNKIGFDIVTTNAGAQAGHTSTHNGVTKVVFHLPTYSLYQPCLTYLNAGSVIDPVGLLKELDENPQVLRNGFAIHPNAAIITPECREAEMRDDSAQTKIASTRKGVGEALSRKVLRSGHIADFFNTRAHKDMSPGHRKLGDLVQRVDLNAAMRDNAAVLVEVPQGHSLSIDGPFYPHTTSRNCTVAAAMSDAGIHPEFYHQSMMVIRTFPIRVGNIPPPEGMEHYPNRGYSGGHFPDQRETSWDELGVKAEITTVTKRVRRVFTFSGQQVEQALAQTRPAVIYLTFCDYFKDREQVRGLIKSLRYLCERVGVPDPEILTQWGPTTDDVIRAEELWA